MSIEDALHKIPLRITDTTLRDAHQSIWATRMRTDDIMGIIDTVDNVGYYSLECWGGATFDVCMRFLREDPWERLRLIKKAAKKTPLQMLLRGQNLVGYRNYSDDVVDKFVCLAAKNGVDIFRVFDALNDSRNLEAVIKAVKKYDGHAQGTLSYTISPVHTIEKYISDAKELVQLGIDSLCIKDMAGIMSPLSAEKLVKALIKEVNVPIQVHTHATSGMAVATYVEAVRAGAGAIDCCVSSMAMSTSQPPVETLAAIFRETNYAAELDMSAIAKISAYFKDLHPKRMQKSSAGVDMIDPGILIHQIPGGMISNFRSQLAQQNALDKLDAVLDEVSAVRKDFGYPPLVTPTSQIVGNQAALNVLMGERYKMVPKEVKEYVKGMYGASPAKMEKAFIEKILGDEKQITHRPADDLKPVLNKITDEIEPRFITQDEDILSYAIFPEVAAEFFKWRATPVDERDLSPADVEMLDNSRELQTAKAPAPASQAKLDSPLVHGDDYKGIGYLLSQSANLALDELTIRKGEFSLSLRTSGAAPSAPRASASTASAGSAAGAPKTEVSTDSAPAAAAKKDFDFTINSPISGTFYSAPGPNKPKFVELGKEINAGDVVCTVEAMKLFNEIKSEKSGVIVAILAKDGEIVQKGQALIGVKC